MIRSFLITLFVIFVFIPTIQAADNADHRELLSKHYGLEKPDGAGPFPAVMLVPGCSGFDAKFAKGHYDGVQSHLVELGFVTLHRIPAKPISGLLRDRLRSAHQLQCKGCRPVLLD